MNNTDIKNIVPGFTMGIVRAIISHPFEMLKIKTQINHNKVLYNNLFKGLHYSIITNALERGIQFGLYEKFKEKDNFFIASTKSSIISTIISLPYNIFLLRKIILNTSITINKNNFTKSAALEYSRNLSGSIIFLSSYNFLKEKDIEIIYRAPISSCLVWLITYPMDTYKNILISNTNIKLNANNLYKGIQYPLMRSIPSSIIGFYVYEYMLNVI